MKYVVAEAKDPVSIFRINKPPHVQLPRIQILQKTLLRTLQKKSHVLDFSRSSGNGVIRKEKVA